MPMQPSPGAPGADAALFEAAGRLLFEVESPVGKALLDRDLRYLAINDTLARFNGCDARAVIGQSVAQVLPDAYPTLEPLLRRVLDHGEAQRNFRVSVPTPSTPDEVSDWEASYLPVLLPDGQVGGVYVQAINLTLTLQAERALRESATLVRRVLDGLFAFVGVLTPDGTLVEANRAPLDAAGISLDQVAGRPFWEAYWWSYSDTMQQWLREATARAAAGELVRRDVTVRMAGDTRMSIDFMLAPLRDEEGRVTHLIPSAIDISDRLLTQRQLETALAEKTVLLQEVHHRVKNNLQIIASLLRLQARQAEPATRAALQDSQTRVMAMALTHELLYERQDFSALEFGPYLRRLCSALRDAQGPLIAQRSIVVDAPAEGLRIGLNQAVPMALCTNELVTNALKHAFPGDRQGEIRVEACTADGGIALRVSDDGVGLSGGALPEGGGALGFSLVRLLSAQVGARFSHHSRPGCTEFTIHLPATQHA